MTSFVIGEVVEHYVMRNGMPFPEFILNGLASFRGLVFGIFVSLLILCDDASLTCLNFHEWNDVEELVSLPLVSAGSVVGVECLG